MKPKVLYTGLIAVLSKNLVRKRDGACMIGTVRSKAITIDNLSDKIMDEIDRQNLLDREFWETFVAASKEADNEIVSHLKLLYDKGATTSCFPAYELSTMNFAKLLEDFLSNGHHLKRIPDSQIIAVLRIAIQAGDAYKTDKDYVGNGGQTAVFFLLYYLGALTSYHNSLQDPGLATKLPVAYDLLETIIAGVRSEDVWDGFWIGFLGSLKYSKNVEPATAKIQLQTLRLVFRERSIRESFCDPYIFDLILNRSFPSLIASRRLDIIHELAALVAQYFPFDDDFSWAIHFQEMAQQEYFRSDILNKLLDLFISDKNSRKILCSLMDSFPWFAGLFFEFPSLVFDLARKKQRVILQRLLRGHCEEMQNLRDDDGNDLLLYICGIRGRVEKIVELLLENGFSLNSYNDLGETPLLRAVKKRNRKLVSFLNFTVSQR